MVKRCVCINIICIIMLNINVALKTKENTNDSFIIALRQHRVFLYLKIGKKKKKINDERMKTFSAQWHNIIYEHMFFSLYVHHLQSKWHMIAIMMTWCNAKMLDSFICNINHIGRYWIHYIELMRTYSTNSLYNFIECRIKSNFEIGILRKLASESE